MRTRNALLSVIVLCLGCQYDDEADPVASEDPTVGNDALGIVRFDTDESETGLSIRGIDELGNTVAEYTITVGMVEVEDDSGLGQTAFGRRVEMKVGGNKYVRAAEGTDPTILLLWEDASDDLVLDPYVSRVLARWGVSYVSRASLAPRGDDGEESAYWSDWCLEGISPAPACGGTQLIDQCSFDHYQMYQQQWYVCAANPDWGWQRVCDQTPGPSGICAPVGGQGCGSCGHFEFGSNAGVFCNGYNQCQWE